MVTLQWSIPNMVTITLMVLISFALIGFVWRAFKGATSSKPNDGNPANAATAQAS